jgi:hypothetical protein
MGNYLNEIKNKGLSDYYGGLALGLEMADGAPWTTLDFAIGANAAREGMFSRRMDNYRGNSFSETLEYIISPKDKRYVDWECPASEGYYRHCVAACRINKVTYSPLITLAIMLTGGNDWPWQWSGINNFADISGNYAGIGASYARFIDCGSMCEPMSKAMSRVLCR